MGPGFSFLYACMVGRAPLGLNPRGPVEEGEEARTGHCLERDVFLGSFVRLLATAMY